MEPSKLKVAELRAELQARGLDSKGVKAILVDRLEQALIAEAEEAEQAEADSVEEIGDDDDEVEQAQEALPEAEQGFGEEFGFTEDSADAGDMMQEDDLLQDTGDDGEGTEGDDDQLLAELDVPQAMVEPEAEPEPEPAAEAVPESAEPVAEPQAEPMEEQAQQPAEEAQEAPKEAEQQEPEAAAESSDAKPDGMEQEEAPKTDDQENKEPATDEDKKDDDKNKERKRDYENRNRDRRVGGRDRSPRRRTPPPAVVMEEDDDIPDTQCVLSKYLSDLNLKIGKDGYSASPLSMEGFAYMWGGVKSTHGVSKGRIGYECKLESQADVRHLPPEETNRHVVRVGWSTDPTSLQLGEEAFSYGYGGTGKASVNCVFSDFGGKFGVNDVITSYVDFEGEKPTISYSKNGEDLGVAFTIEDDLNGQALFPHVMVKNISVEMNFGQREEPWFPLKEEFTFIGKLSEEDTVRGPKPPATKKECELLMMVGLPGSGKTTWAINYCKENPEKKYYILGTNLIMDKMKVMGLRRQRNYAGRWDKLMDLATKCLNRFFEVAARKRRNYILDQTNVYPSARRRKMRPFEGFNSKAIVLVPTDEEFLKRVEKRTKEEGKDVPDHAVNEMKANFELPEKGVLFDEVEFIELKDEEVKTLVEKYRKDGAAAGGLKPRYDNRRPGGGFRGGFNRDDRRGGGYQSNYRQGGGGGYDRDRRGGYGNRGGYRDGGWNRGGYGGSQGSGGYNSRGGGYNSGSSYNSSRGSGGGYRGSGGSSSYSSGGSYNRNQSSGYGGNQSSGSYNRNQGSSYNKYGNQSSYNQNRQSGYGNQASSYGSSGSGSSNYSSNQGYGQNSSQGYGSSSGYGSSTAASNTSGGSYNQSGSYGQQYQQQQQTPQQQQYAANYQQQYSQYYQQNPQYAQQYAQYYGNYGNYGSGSGTTQ